MDPNQLPPGMFTPERPSGSNANDQNNTASLLSSPFLLFANALSPITPSRALLAQGVSDAQAAALTALPARSPAPLCFSSPSNQKSAAGKSTGDRKRSNLSKANASEQPSGLEEVAMSADAAVLAAVNALAQSPLRPGVLDDVQDVASVAALRKQLESEFNVNLTEPESNIVRSISKLEKELLSLDDELGLDDSLLPRHVLRSPGHQTTRPAGRVRGAAARLGTPAGVGAVADMAAAEAGADANKRSSTTGASMEWPHGLSKTIKKDGEDSPRMRSATARGKARGSTASSRGAGAKGKKGAAAAAALLEEEMNQGRPNSAPAGRGGRAVAQSDRRLSVAAAATPAAKGERAPRPSLDSLRDDGSPQQCASKKCNCKKSKCLKLYCECFAAGAFCDACSCQNCQNTPDNANLVAMTRQQIELRNPQAFADKIVATDGTGEDARHKKGCHCKKSACLKKYCECFQAGVLCQDYCKCEGCKNKDDGSPNFGRDRGAKMPTAKDTPRRVAAATAAAVAAVEEAAMNFMASEDEHDLIIEDLIDIKSPGRSGAAVLAAADGLGLNLLQSPPKVSPGGGGFNSVGPMATPMKRAEMSPLTPGSRTILRAGPGRTTLTGGAAANTRSKVPPPRFDQAKDVAANDVTPKITRSAKNRARGFGSLPGSHDALAGGMIATLGSPVPLSTPEGFE